MKGVFPSAPGEDPLRLRRTPFQQEVSLLSLAHMSSF